MILLNHLLLVQIEIKTRVIFQKENRREVVMGLMQGFFFELCNIFNSYAPDASAVVKSKLLLVQIEIKTRVIFQKEKE